MVFSSLIFVFGFLPVAIVGAFILKKCIKLQNLFLLALSLIFYSYGEPRYIVLFLLTIVLNWAAAYASSFLKNLTIKRCFGVLTIVVDILILFWFKYSGWCFSGINRIFDIEISIPVTVLPIGISFYTFQAISYVADVVLMGKYEAQRNPVIVGLYIAFFPQLIAGPIVRYEDLADKMMYRQMSIEEFSQGCIRFMYGFSKKILLADTVAVIVDKAFSNLGSNELSMSFAWLGAIAFTLQIFLDFSAYSDMAIGLGHMFGFTIRENFNVPYKAATVRDFWRRWHISLSIWFRDYIYVPLGGNRVSQKRLYFNVAVVWLLTGIWHGANWTFIVWGVSYGALVVFERYFSIEERLKKNGYRAAVYRVFTLLAVVLLWVVFRADNIFDAVSYIKCMFNISTLNLGFHQTILYLSEYKWALAIGLLISFQPEITTRIKKIMELVGCPLLLVLFVISVSYLVKGTFSPFLYFNF